MEKLKAELIRYKWVFIIGLVVAIVAGIVAANLHVISFMNYKSKGDTASIIELLEKDISNTARQDDWYFKEGVNYLLQDEGEESLAFFEKHLEEFILERQYDIIAGYNTKQLVFKNKNAFIKILMQDVTNEACLTYLKRIEPSQLDEELFYYFGTNKEVTPEFVENVCAVLKGYPNKLPLNKFQFSLYDVLLLSNETMSEQKDIIFSKVDPAKARTLLFKEMKSEPVDLNILKTWVEFLNKNKVLEQQDYTSFSTMYSEIQVALKAQKELDAREIDLNNKKETIDLQIGDSEKMVVKKEQGLSDVQKKIAGVEGKLEGLADYAYMALYIEKPSGSGTGEYEASIPKKNIFGNYKPSSQKYIVKLSTTEFYTEGVYYVDVYLKGTKTNSKGNEYPYYIEVSSEQIASIGDLQKEREGYVTELNTLNAEVQKLKSELETLKKELGYEQNQKDLVNLAKERQDFAKKLDEKVVGIKSLFGIGTINIPEVK